jgi:hypothetical protein
MKKSLLIITIFLSVLLLLFGCAQTKLADYQPNSAEEKEVIDFILECDEAYQNRDITKWLACHHDNAKIKISVPGNMSGGPIVSKSQYKEYCEAGKDKDMSRSGMLNPKITMTDDRATIEFQHQEEFLIMETWDLVKENEKWSIIRSDWTWQ